MSTRYIAAIDLGASSGRVMLATFNQDDKSLSLSEIHRFKNCLQLVDGHHCWDLDYLEQQIICGLTKLEMQNIKLDSAGIDTWGVDYVLLDKDGKRVGPSYSYRDHRTDGIMETVFVDLGKETIYQRTGIQFLPFNTLYQLKAMMNEKPEWLDRVTDFVMIPDYLIYRLTGKLNREYTNATTSQLVNVNTDNWDTSLLDYLNLPHSWFGTVRHPGHKVGKWQSLSGHAIPIISVASHDTASAVIAVPLTSERQAYLSSGTWSLMGIDTLTPCTSEQALNYNITNEGGIDGHYRVLKNIMGLWLFQRICHEHHITDIPEFVAKTTLAPPFKSLINPNAPRFLNPASMTDEIRLACQENKQPIPHTAEELARCVFDSLALLYRQVINELSHIHHPITQLHIVGGGCQNDFLNQLCADVCGIPVIAGPAEASTLGNIGCQLMALNEINDVVEFRQIVTKNFPIRVFKPQVSPSHEHVWHTFYDLS